jgi:predicted TIM-barrel fold metal-dependent hydrolase
MPKKTSVALMAFALLGPAGGSRAEETRLSPTALGRIDAHAHVLRSDPAFYRLLERLDVRLVNICVVDRYDPGYETAEPQHKVALEVFRQSKGRAAWCSTFDDTDWESPGFSGRAIAQLDRTFADGAVAVKIYKSIGMELRSKDGRYVLPDDPVFAPILDAVAARGKTLYAHIAEPLVAWQPLDPKSPDFGYYQTHPAWHVYGRPGVPTKAEILAARDRMIERHPSLRVIGCHLGSMEEDVDEIARRLDRFPNFAVDTAGRVTHLALQPREKVRAFMIRYQDRLLYATDLGINPGQDPAEAVKGLEAEWARDWRFFATGDEVEYEGRKVHGLELPAEVLRRFYRENALRWVPGLSTAARAPGR